jgi:hypothetical protein
VIKAVLLNSASKNAGWDNGEVVDAKGVIRTMQALDPAVGTGMLDLHRALLQYAGGVADVPGVEVNSPVVPIVGWDYAVARPGKDNDYYLAGLLNKGEQMAVTLDWFVNRELDEATGEATDVSFADLDLEVWLVIGGLPTKLVASSESAYSNVEHLFFELPLEGEYMLRVRYFSDAYMPNDPGSWGAEAYAIAWMVPEPMAPLLLVVGGVAVGLRRRRERGNESRPL